jgi:hypothetical protein
VGQVPLFGVITAAGERDKCPIEGCEGLNLSPSFACVNRCTERRGGSGKGALIGILQQGNLPCSFVSPEVICKGRLLYVEISF